MSASLNSSVVSASAFYDHHRAITRAEYQKAMQTESGQIDPNRPTSAEDATAINPAAGGDDDSFSFFDLLDIINPLQHIPIISSIYRAITGDEIGGPARILGGALYGGPVGLVAGVVNTVVDEASGHDVGEHVMMALTGEGDKPDLPPPLRPADKAPVMLASNSGDNDIIWRDAPGTQIRAGTRDGEARDARTLAQSAPPLSAVETAKGAVLASSLLHENASRAEARAGDGVPTALSPAAQPSSMPMALQPPLAPGLVVQTMMENLDAYGDMARERTDAPEDQPVYEGYYYGS